MHAEGMDYRQGKSAVESVALYISYTCACPLPEAKLDVNGSVSEPSM